MLDVSSTIRLSPKFGAFVICAFLFCSRLLAQSVPEQRLKNSVLDAETDFGLICDGSTINSKSWSDLVDFVSRSDRTPTITFRSSSLCVIPVGKYTFNKSVVLKGENGGGLKLSSGAKLSQNLLDFVSVNSVYSIFDFTLDLNGATFSSTVSAMFFYTKGALSFSGSRILNAGSQDPSSVVNLLIGYNLTECRIEDSVFSFLQPSNQPNQTINLGTPGSAVSHCTIDRNTSINSGIAFYSGNHVHITNNEIFGYGFGAGLTLGPDDTIPVDLKVTGNSIHDSLYSLDVLKTPLTGIENWFYDASITNNYIKNVCGAGIGSGARAHIVGNEIINAGRCKFGINDRAAINLTGGGAFKSSGSTIDANVAFNDEADGMLYGVADLETIEGSIGTNDLQGLLGAYFIRGATSFRSPQTDNRVQQPCGAPTNQKGAAELTTANQSNTHWKLFVSTPGVLTEKVVYSRMQHCSSALNVTVTRPLAALDNSAFYLSADIPAAWLSDLSYRSPQAKRLILAFCAETNFSAPFTGSVSLLNKFSNVTYSVAYQISVPEYQSQCFSFRVPGDRDHSLVDSSSSTPALSLVFDLGSGRNTLAETSASWSQGQLLGVLGTDSFVSRQKGSSISFSDFRLLPAEADLGWAPEPQ